MRVFREPALFFFFSFFLLRYLTVLFGVTQLPTLGSRRVHLLIVTGIMFQSAAAKCADTFFFGRREKKMDERVVREAPRFFSPLITLFE